MLTILTRRTAKKSLAVLSMEFIGRFGEYLSAPAPLLTIHEAARAAIDAAGGDGNNWRDAAAVFDDELKRRLNVASRAAKVLAWAAFLFCDLDQESWDLYAYEISLSLWAAGRRGTRYVLPGLQNPDLLGRLYEEEVCRPKLQIDRLARESSAELLTPLKQVALEFGNLTFDNEYPEKGRFKAVVNEAAGHSLMIRLRKRVLEELDGSDVDAIREGCEAIAKEELSYPPGRFLCPLKQIEGWE